MTHFATLRAKGKITLPAEVRERLSLHEGDRFLVIISDDESEIVLRRIPTLEELSEYLTNLIPPGTEPVTDVRAYYRAHRGAPR